MMLTFLLCVLMLLFRGIFLRKVPKASGVIIVFFLFVCLFVCFLFRILLKKEDWKFKIAQNGSFQPSLVH